MVPSEGQGNFPFCARNEVEAVLRGISAVQDAKTVQHKSATANRGRLVVHFGTGTRFKYSNMEITF